MIRSSSRNREVGNTGILATKYWKILPAGHRVTVQLETRERRNERAITEPEYEQVSRHMKACEELAANWRKWRKSFEAVCEQL
jgi:hypothetical protein